MGRTLGIDFGSRRVGLALSDESRRIASPLTTLEYESKTALFRRLVSIVEDRGVTRIVVGLPINMKGRKTPQTEKVEEFLSRLRNEIPIPVETVDERLTSVEAERVLHIRGVKPSRNKGLVDRTAAAILLQAYLDGLQSR